MGDDGVLDEKTRGNLSALRYFIHFATPGALGGLYPSFGILSRWPDALHQAFAECAACTLTQLWDPWRLVGLDSLRSMAILPRLPHHVQDVSIPWLQLDFEIRVQFRSPLIS